MAKQKLLTLLFLSFTSVCLADTIELKSGKVVNVQNLQKTDKNVTAEVGGVKITYWFDEIEKINGEKVVAASSGSISKLTQDQSANPYEEAIKYLVEPSNFYDVVNESIKNFKADSPGLQSILKDNQKALDLFRRAALQTSDGYLLIKKSELMDIKLTTHRHFKAGALFKLCLLEGAVLNSKGSKSEVENDYLAAIRFLKHLSEQKVGGKMVVVMRGIWVNQLYPQINTILTSELLSKDFYQKLLQELLAIQNGPQRFKATLEQERDFAWAHGQSIRADVDKTKYPEDFLTQADAIVKAHLDEITQAEIEAVLKNKPEILGDKSKELRESWEKDLKALNVPLDPPQVDFSSDEEFKKACVAWLNARTELSTPKFFAEFWSHAMHSTASFDFSLKHKGYSDMAWAEFNNFILATAIRLFQIDNGKLPDSLEALGPKYLEKIPVDPFNNEAPLKYVKKENGFFIYSLGADKANQQGNVICSLEEPKYDPKQACDIVLEIQVNHSQAENKK